MTFLYRLAPIQAYCKENFEKEVKSLPPTLAKYAEEAKEGEPRARRLAGMQALAACLAHLSLAAPPIALGRYGKPYFTEGEHQFSISHAGDLAVAVLAPHRVGADLEPYDREISEGTRERILRKCSDAESERMRSLCGEARARAFLELWVKKEALMKKDGRGLGALMDADTAATLPHFTDSFFREGKEYFIAIY